MSVYVVSAITVSSTGVVSAKRSPYTTVSEGFSSVKIYSALGASQAPGDYISDSVDSIFSSGKGFTSERAGVSSFTSTKLGVSFSNWTNFSSGIFSANDGVSSDLT